MLNVSGLRYRIGGRLVLDGASFSVAAGRRAALVGRNGAGKSTLLRLVAGELEAESGEVRLPRGARVAHVAQAAPSGAASARDFVLAADRERARLLAAAARETDGARLAGLHARLAEIGAHAAPARAAAILRGLGFDARAQEAPLDSFSGGWRMRAGLAAALFAEPDLLLLDEPTNHLDLEASLWLTAFLARWPRALLLCSHDRAVIDKAATDTVHLERGRTRAYRGGWSAFVRARSEGLARDAAERKRVEAERRRMTAYVERFRYKATKARQAQSRLKALAKLAAPPPPPPGEAPPRLRFPDPAPLAPPLLALEGAAAGYGAGPPALRGLDLRIDADDRIALLGANGEGKSTLLRLLAGRMAPAAGAVRRAARLSVGYYAQDGAEALDPDMSAERHVAALLPEAGETARRAHCGRFGFAGARADLPAAALSGGEAVRLALALICCARPHILLLDEPTNHLDIDSREAFVEALNAWTGAAVLVTHDEDVIARAADRLWLVADGTCRPFDGDLEDYRRLTLSRRGGGGAAGPGKSAGGRGAERRRATAAAAPLRRAARAAEAKAAALGAELAALDARIADPALYAAGADPARAADLNRRRAEAAKALAAAEADWLAAEEAAESDRSGSRRPSTSVPRA